jgi:hypothetical protein
LHLLIDFYYEDGYKHKNYNNEIINKFIEELPDFSYIYIDDKRRYEDFEKYLKDENTNSIIVVDENLNCFKNIIKIKKDILEEYNNHVSGVIKKTNTTFESLQGDILPMYKGEILYNDEYVVPGYEAILIGSSKTITVDNNDSLPVSENNTDVAMVGRTIIVNNYNSLHEFDENRKVINRKCSKKINNCHCKDKEENDIEVDFEVLFQILREKFSYGYIPQMDEENLILSIEISDKDDKKIINSYIEFKINPTPIGEIIKENIVEKQFKIFYD